MQNDVAPAVLYSTYHIYFNRLFYPRDRKINHFGTNLYLQYYTNINSEHCILQRTLWRPEINRDRRYGFYTIGVWVMCIKAILLLFIIFVRTPEWPRTPIIVMRRRFSLRITYLYYYIIICIKYYVDDGFPFFIVGFFSTDQLQLHPWHYYMIIICPTQSPVAGVYDSKSTYMLK